MKDKKKISKIMEFIFGIRLESRVGETSENSELSRIRKDGIKTLVIFTIATIIAAIILGIARNETNVAVCYMLGVVLISRFTSGYIWGITASIVSVFGVNYFMYPVFALDFKRSGYSVTFIVLLLVSLLTSTMTVHSREQTRKANEHDERTRKLYDISKKLLTIRGMDNIVEYALDCAVSFTNHSAVLYEKDPQSTGAIHVKSIKDEDYRILTSSHEVFLAHRAFINRKDTGVGIDLYRKSSAIYLPILIHDSVFGVLGILCDSETGLLENEVTFLRLITAQLALAMERQHISDMQRKVEIEAEKEKMRGNLLRAVSHDLRTPLTGIIGASETMIKNGEQLSEEEKVQLLNHINEDSNWLLHMVENLLSVTRIRDDNSTVSKTKEPLDEVVAEAVGKIKKRYPNGALRVNIPEELLMVSMDATLIEQVIINLVENSMLHASSLEPIELGVEQIGDKVSFRIMDRGIGLPESELGALFDGVSTNPNQSSDSTKGMGIGLSICKSIITAHGGTITAANREGGGAIFTFILPIN